MLKSLYPNLHHSSKLKSHKEVAKQQNDRNQGFSYFFSLLMEGSGSGSVQINYGSGSGRLETDGSRSGTLVLFFYSLSSLKKTRREAVDYLRSHDIEI